MSRNWMDTSTVEYCPYGCEHEFALAELRKLGAIVQTLRCPKCHGKVRAYYHVIRYKGYTLTKEEGA
jgi:hypothetical protein